MPISSQQNIYKLVQSRKAEFSSLYSRMDADRDLYQLKRYHMTNPVDGQAVPNIVEVTLTDPKLYAEKANAIICGAEMQTEVTGEGLSDSRTTAIERFLEAAYLAIDRRLNNRGIPGLFAFATEQACLRGRIAARCLVRKQGDGVLFDILPLDTRYLCYEHGADGLKWAAPEFTRTKAQMLDEYGVEVMENSTLITDVWTAQEEIIYLGENELKRQAHSCGYVPFVLAQVPAGSMFADADSFQYSGESIFAPNRSLYPELNRLATVLTNEVMAGWMGAMQYESEAGSQAARPKVPPYGVRAVIPVEKDGGYKPMPHESVVETAKFLYELLDARKQQGSFSTMDYGDMKFPTAPATVMRLMAAKNDVVLPRIQAIASFYQQLSRMIITQFVAGELTASLKAAEGSRMTFAPADLYGEYDIKYRFFTSSPEEDVANYAVAAAAQGFVSGDTIRRDILKLKDPDGENAKIQAERSELQKITAQEKKKAKPSGPDSEKPS